MKKSEMKAGVTYFLCPDKGKKCGLFFDKSFACANRACPFQDKLVIMIFCETCGKTIELPADHWGFERIDHICLNGVILFLIHFIEYGTSRLIYELEE